MKKILLFLLLLLVLLCLSACDGTGNYGQCYHPDVVSDKSADHIYKLGDTISLFYEESGAPLGTLVIHNALILDEDDARDELNDHYLGSYTDHYDAVVQINYSFHLNEEDFHLSARDFSFTDCQGNAGTFIRYSGVTYASSPVEYTAYDYFICALNNAGDYLYIDLLDHNGNTIARVQAYYGQGENEIDPNKLVSMIALIALTLICVICMLCQLNYRKKLQQQYEIFFPGLRSPQPPQMPQKPDQEGTP